jgi:integrase/recombinase XerD
MQKCSAPIRGLSSIRSREFVKDFDDYGNELDRAGYSPYSKRRHLLSVAHFGVWLEVEGVGLNTIDDETVNGFGRHLRRCKCQGVSRARRRHVVSCVRVFLRYLRDSGKVQIKEVAPARNPLVCGFLEWLRAHRGVVQKTVESYGTYVMSLVAFLGDDPQTYTASGLRDFCAKRYRHYGRNSIRMVLAAVRMFLRYLAVEGLCRVGLEHALVSPAKWSKQSLPRGLTDQDAQKVLTQCPSTPRGLRDRAILLLLFRLGLRAGDVTGLRVSDLCFKTGTIRVSGKGSREVRLPLPQHVGDALLDYLRSGRPQVDSDHLFVRSLAPFGAFASGCTGAAVSHVARSALKRARVQPPTRGSHVFRHSAACHMLCAGVELEGIADVLRHRSVETTVLYAKVHLQLLQQVAQPWPEVVPC